MCRHVYTKSENYKHVINTYRHGMYIFEIVPRVYAMYIHGLSEALAACDRLRHSDSTDMVYRYGSSDRRPITWPPGRAGPPGELLTAMLRIELLIVPVL